MSKKLNVAVKAAKNGGKILKKYYGNVKTEYKNNSYDIGSILTKADIESEKNIVKVIRENFPEHNIFSEELVKEENNSKYSWHIDPLDGTSNFVRNIPLFGISIGLIKNGQPILGVLYFPILNLFVWAEKDKGAYANGKKINVSALKLNKSLYYSGGIFKGVPQIRKRVSKKVGIVKIIDASSFEFAQIAMGDAELYILDNVLHDVVAGVVIVREAGGEVTDYDGSKWSVKSKGIVASNKIIHDDIIKLLK